MNYNFSVFILTHGRPDNVITVKTLRKFGYTGRIIIILDDLDKNINEYKKNYPECDFYVFSKKEAMELTDSADNTNNPKAVVYARNMTHRIAKELGIDYFLVLDDDYDYFVWRSDFEGHYMHKGIKNLDGVFNICLDFLSETSDNVKCIALAQNGDYIGGSENYYGKTETLTRKCMNSFFCKTDRPFCFYGLIN